MLATAAAAGQASGRQSPVPREAGLPCGQGADRQARRRPPRLLARSRSSWTCRRGTSPCPGAPPCPTERCSKPAAISSICCSTCTASCRKRSTHGTRAGLDETREADAVHLVMLEFSGGRLAQITIDRLCRAGTRYIELRADCEEASLRASHGGRVLLQMGMKRAERPGIRLHYGLGGVAWAERGLHRKKLARNPRNPGVAATVTLFREIVAAFPGRSRAAVERQPGTGRPARDRGRLSLGGHGRACGAASAPLLPDRQRGGRRSAFDSRRPSRATAGRRHLPSAFGRS